MTVASVPPTVPTKTLFVIPCSGAKLTVSGERASGPAILDELPPDLAETLQSARRANAPQATLDETTLLPAWQRYSGTLYQIAAPVLVQALTSGAHILILSGGYGAVLADEPIGWYEAIS